MKLLARMLVTGGAGFIGCALVEHLVRDGHRVLVVDCLHPQVHPSGGRPSRLHLSAELLVGDIALPSTWVDVFERMHPEVVIHLAAETGTGQSFNESTRHAYTNVLGTTQMLDALLAARVIPDQIVLASSRAVYGEGEWVTPAGQVFYPRGRSSRALESGQWDPIGPEGETGRHVANRAHSTITAPSSVYGATKLCQEGAIMSWTAGTGSALSVLRLQNVYGPGQSLYNSYTGIVSLFGRLACASTCIPVYEDGLVTRDFVYIDDVVDAFRRALMRQERTMILDIGSGVRTSVLELASLIAGKRGAPAPSVTGEYRVGDVRAAVCDAAPAQETLGFVSRHRLDQGIESTLAWINELEPVQSVRT